MISPAAEKERAGNGKTKTDGKICGPAPVRTKYETADAGTRERTLTMKKYDVILFDLDGTLLDSLEDMKNSVNHVMRLFGYPEHTLDEVRSYIGNGIRKLIERSLPADAGAETVEKALAEYRRYYDGHCMICTHPYPGIPELLKELKERGFLLAVVTNKNHEAAEAMCSRYFPGIFSVVLGQRDSMPKKPDSAMVSAAMDRLDAADRKAVYIGDSEVDILTAENAGIDGIICLWGFREESFLRERGARVTVSRAEEIAVLV